MKIKQISPVMPLIVVFLIGDAVFWWLGLCENNRAGIFLGIFILIMIILMATLMLKVVTITKDGCTITALFRQKTYKWSELEIIRRDCLKAGQKYMTGMLDGIVFSEKKKGKEGKVYSSYEIYTIYIGSPRLDCFCIIYEKMDIKILNTVRKWFGKTSELDPLEDALEKLSEWGVEVEEGKKYLRYKV